MDSARAQTASSKTRAADAHDKSNSIRLWDHFSQISSRHALLWRVTLQPRNKSCFKHKLYINPDFFNFLSPTILSYSKFETMVGDTGNLFCDNKFDRVNFLVKCDFYIKTANFWWPDCFLQIQWNCPNKNVPVIRSALTKKVNVIRFYGQLGLDTKIYHVKVFTKKT